MLSCYDCVRYLDAFLDNELGVKESLDIQEHMSVCAACAGRAAAERKLRTFIRQHATVLPLPDDVKRRIVHQAMPASVPQSAWARFRGAVHSREFTMGMATAAAVFLLVFVGLFSRAFEKEDMIQKFVREASLAYQVYKTQHVPLEVQGSNDTVVVQWFNSRMGQQLKVPCITDQATKLLGGRLCRLLDRHSAVLRYQRHGTDIYVFAFKGPGVSLPAKSLVHTKAGDVYVHRIDDRLVALWKWGDTTYSMVGDLNRDDFLQVANTIDYR
jgi:anti-sigma factor RsiW